MNIFFYGCLARYCRIPFWNTAYYKNRIASFSLVSPDDVFLPQFYCTQQLKPLVPNCLRIEKHHILSGLNGIKQVRFQNNCPQLHRDLCYPNFDRYRKDNTKDVRRTEWGAGDQKGGHTYAIGYFGLLCGAYAVKTGLTVFLTSMSPAADVLAMSVIEVDISKVPPGGCLSFKWRGKPLFVKNRTAQEISIEENTPLGTLRDPEAPDKRVQKPNWLIVIGICTHLGCVPIANTGDFVGGFYCPCHGSQFDNLGRARKGPAPTNLVVPPYKFVSETSVLVG